jgi:hypothetical protein
MKTLVCTRCGKHVLEIVEPKTCTMCGREFTPNRPGQLTCGAVCAMRQKKAKLREIGEKRRLARRKLIAPP